MLSIVRRRAPRELMVRSVPGKPSLTQMYIPKHLTRIRARHLTCSHEYGLLCKIRTIGAEVLSVPDYVYD